MTSEGSLISFAANNDKEATIYAAISANIWNTHKKNKGNTFLNNTELQFQIYECEVCLIQVVIFMYFLICSLGGFGACDWDWSHDSLYGRRGNCRSRHIKSKNRSTESTFGETFTASCALQGIHKLLIKRKNCFYLKLATPLLYTKWLLFFFWGGIWMIWSILWK